LRSRTTNPQVPGRVEWGDAHRLVSPLGQRLKSPRGCSRLHRCRRRDRGGGHRRRSVGLVRLAARRSAKASTSCLVADGLTARDALDAQGSDCQSREVNSCALGFAELGASCGAVRATPSTGGRGSKTSDLPCAPNGNRSQPTAPVFGCLSRSRRCRICQRLPPFATTGLHQGSILRCLG
jgi:hypothetical protein